ncbi:MAG TPA: maltose alpha-D-glucosyltransferase [Polyangiaceae bacterium]|jgi:maltose alpha-D-glucosyltransferase/alpha-amylase
MTSGSSNGTGSRRPPADGPTWYKDAIIYELRTRSFYDSNEDGVGDLPGLASRLDYLSDLGVTAIWLLPFYPSPGKDDGYDISNYTDVHPDVGTLADFESVLAEAHKRGIKVITELVLNHTSDQHPWFQRARRAPPGSPERDFYVWASSPEGYKDARIIFKDFEQSNWSWDRVANAYYWHRFYGHQPDLNFENAAVQEALLATVDFWLDKGVDGLRLDAVPYLYEEEGTNCENLPQTHAFLKKLRAHIDAKYPNRMLLAEANQWPEDAAAYFGRGDECHMNFHFPLMPRMFMSIHMEDRFPIVDIFAQTPEVDPSCQWALFLRNHDELTLEMVTDEERDYMYRAYAERTAMRINLGIRRRLAPLMANDRRKMELLNGLLFSLPGTPVLYYGDEIGMGDNVYLGDRNGVRTPMQWSMDRNAGFSRANPQQLILPVVIDPEYHYESLNVENQQQNPNSLLWWTKRLIALRKRFAAFGRGTVEYLNPANPRILAFVRAHEEETVLVVANLSRFAQYTELDLSKYKGMLPQELFGKARFPAVGDAPYPLTLGPHGFYWFSLERPKTTEERLSVPPPPAGIECTSLEALLSTERSALEDVLPHYLEGRPWYAGRDRPVRSTRVEDVHRLGTDAQRAYFVFVRVEYLDDEAELYSLPLAWVPSSRPVAENAAMVARVRCTADGADGSLVDAGDDGPTARAILEAIARREQSRTRAGMLAASVASEEEIQATMGDPSLEPHKVGTERHHSTIRYGERFMLRCMRRIDEGPSPELEVTRYLAARVTDIAPKLRGALELVSPMLGPMAVCALYAFVPSAGTAWQLTTEELRRYFERVLARPPGDCPPPPVGSPILFAGQSPPQAVSEMIGGYKDTAAQLGVRVAELHLALVGSENEPSFVPEPYTGHDRRSKYQTLRNLSGKVFRMLRDRLPVLPVPARQEAASILEREPDLLRSFEPLLRAKMSGLRIRTHGDLHLSHILYTGKGFVVTDFHGLEDLTLTERRRKRSPLRDLAWMVRSFDIAASRRLFDPTSVRETDVATARPWAMQWSSWVAATFLGAYLGRVAGAPFLSADREATAILFDSFVVEQALYQLRRDLEERSPTIHIALHGLAHLMGGA